ncbi:tRNA (5-methylaminomethyl-2-thiouridine)(34)-methyltransferase MnmD [Thioalkalivibrio sp. ALJ7]|uniref:tRNA (5-methylaminomethyl-2-thiouridine)(34)-methyltransferase MnmD n=1 Tax=Thioalkalivibrio sp. ALJ7 TaxID=1158756 RepID=UPI00036BFFB8|nr:tRNA (5-methylaminomethyl-2-thiouridine)(34)-methyltransferase MnmD [Thioalkalivibrio sp. ALJ7]
MTSPSRPLLDWARLEWRDGRPFAVDYGDGYFGSLDPQAEVREVFIDANDLSRRFAGAQRFSIGETGFGSGLNVLLALEEWRRHAPPNAFLSILSLEAHPLSPGDLLALHRHLGLDDADSHALRDQYPAPIPGLHRIEFPGARAVLTLGLGEAAPLLTQVQGRVDAWFFDGFAPRSNPALWNTGVFRQVARLSGPGTTFGTYTAAGQVRRDLESVGFSVHRVAGHGRKRERLLGSFKTTCPGPAVHPIQHVAVVGGGLAGVCMADALHRRGVRIDLFDPAGIAAGASGNPAAVLLPNLHPRDPELNRLAIAGMRQTRALIQRLEDPHGPCLRLATGVAFHGISAHGQKRVARLLKAGPEATGLLFNPEGPGCAAAPHLFYPHGLAVDMGALCRAAAQDLPAIHKQAVLSLNPCDDGAGVMLETPDEQPLRFDAVVLANAAGTGGPLCPEQSAISTVMGQMTRIRAPFPDWGGYVATGQGYCIPEGGGTAWIGATYRRTEGTTNHLGTDKGPLAEDDAANLRHLNWVPGLDEADKTQVLDQWVGERAVVRDRLPLVGTSRLDPNGRVLMNVAHGSRGLLYAPLASEWLADHLLGLVEPLETAVAARLSPSRLDIEASGD